MAASDLLVRPFLIVHGSLAWLVSNAQTRRDGRTSRVRDSNYNVVLRTKERQPKTNPKTLGRPCSPAMG